MQRQQSAASRWEVMVSRRPKYARWIGRTLMAATMGLCLLIGLWLSPERLFQSIWTLLGGWTVIIAASEGAWRVLFNRAAAKGRRSYVVDLLLPMSIQTDVQANLEELMPLWIAAHGEKKARRIRRVQICYVVAGHWWSIGVDNLGKIVGIVTGR